MKQLRKFSDDELVCVIDAAKMLLAERGSARRKDTIRAGNSTYFLESRTCGQAKTGVCKKCESGEEHGPYWYKLANDPVTGKRVVEYVGPPHSIRERAPELVEALRERDEA